MHGAHAFLQALTVVLCVAGVTTVLFQRLGQPVVLGYVLAGLVVGPHVPIPLVADVGVVQTLSELGVILLMFALGLEFSLGKLAKVGPAAGVTAIIQCSLMLWLGFLAARAFGWTILEALYAGALLSISSTTIIAKAFDEQRVHGRLRELVVGILIVEDLIAILLMAALTALSSTNGLDAATLAATTGRLALFLVVLVVAGLLVIPRVVRYVVRLDRPETTLVMSVGICFGLALLALEFGYSVALGAFLAGSLVSESGEAKVVAHLVEPVKNVFAAIFFVSVGMLIDPGLVAEHWVPVVVFTGLVLVGKITSVTLGAFVTGNGTRLSVEAGLSLSQIGEFSFIIAALGVTLGATGEFLYAVAVAVSAITTLTTPYLIRASGRVGQLVDHKLPRPLQTFTTLYESWLLRIRTAPPKGTTGEKVRRTARLLLLDALILGAVIIGTTLSLDALVRGVEERVPLGAGMTRLLVLAAAFAVAMPFCLGVVGLARRLAELLAGRAFHPAPADRPDLAAAPRRALVLTLQFAIVLLVTAPLLAVSQPFLATSTAAFVPLAVLLALGFAWWRSARNLHGHVRAGAQVIVDALAAQALRPSASGYGDGPAAHVLQQLLPGLGEPRPVQLGPGSFAVGRSLAELNLRGRTGATVLAITRPEGELLVPEAHERLRAGDLLALTGTPESVDSAAALLREGSFTRR